MPWSADDAAVHSKEAAGYHKRTARDEAALSARTFAGHRNRKRAPMILNLIFKFINLSGCSAVGSAPALGAGCREFESRHSDHKTKGEQRLSFYFMPEKRLERSNATRMSVAAASLMAANLYLRLPAQMQTSLATRTISLWNHGYMVP